MRINFGTSPFSYAPAEELRKATMAPAPQADDALVDVELDLTEASPCPCEGR